MLLGSDVASEGLEGAMLPGANTVTSWEVPGVLTWKEIMINLNEVKNIKELFCQKWRKNTKNKEIIVSSTKNNAQK